MCDDTKDIAFNCDRCGKAIYEGDTIYVIDFDKVWCKDCIESIKDVAEIDRG